MLLTWICDEPSLYGKIKQYVGSDNFTEPVYQKVAKLLFDQIEANSFKPEIILNSFETEEDHKEVAKIFDELPVKKDEE